MEGALKDAQYIVETAVKGWRDQGKHQDATALYLGISRGDYRENTYTKQAVDMTDLIPPNTDYVVCSSLSSIISPLSLRRLALNGTYS